MPELPEVETVKCGLQPHCVGQIIEQVEVRQPKLRWPVPQVVHRLTGEIQGLERRGKYLIFTMPEGAMLMHLGMTGVCRVLPEKDPLQKHDHVIIHFANNTSLRFNDSRRFGSVLWADNPLEHPLLKGLGVEPLSDGLDGDYIMQATRGRRVAIKQWLMNSHQIVGVGNIYASESLFLAGIHPLLPAGELMRDQAERLADQVKWVLKQAIDAGGTTLKDFKNTDGKPGYFRHNLQVYARAGESCYQCGSKIMQCKLGQRSTYYCAHCQPGD